MVKTWLCGVDFGSQKAWLCWAGSLGQSGLATAHDT